MNQAPKTAFGESSRIDIRSAFVGFVAAALLAVLLMPDAKRVAQFVLLVLVVSIAAATLCGFTFWPKARVRIARLLRWRYRVVRRNAATVALVGLSLFVTQHISLRIRDSRPVSLQAVNAHAPVTPAPVMITSPSLPLRSSIPSQSGTLAAKRENGPVVQPRVVVHPAGQPTIVPVVQPGSRPKELPQVHELGPPPVHRIRTEVLPAPLPAGLFNPDSKTIADGFVQSRDWLLRLNDYRSAAGLQRVEEDPQWSQAAANHARYLTETYGERLKAGHPPTLAEMHHENSQNRWYSPKSALAAQTGDEAMLPFRFDPVIAIDGWIIAPFHRPALLMGKLMHVGYGEYCVRGVCAASMTLMAGADSSDPIEFPPDGATVALRQFDYPEAPNPLAFCAGYKLPVGLPITLQLGGPRFRQQGDTLVARASAETWAPILSAYSIKENGHPVAVCGFSTGETFPLVILLPRTPLIGGSTYAVHIIANRRSYDWRFSVDKRKAVPTLHALQALQEKRSSSRRSTLSASR